MGDERRFSLDPIKIDPKMITYLPRANNIAFVILLWKRAGYAGLTSHGEDLEQMKSVTTKIQTVF